MAAIMLPILSVLPARERLCHMIANKAYAGGIMSEKRHGNPVTGVQDHREKQELIIAEM